MIAKIYVNIFRFIRGRRKPCIISPITLPFLLMFFFIFLVLLLLIEIGILGYAYQRLRINQRYVLALLLLSLFGSYINIPVYQVPPETVYSSGQVIFYGIRHVIPFVTLWPGTIIAVNLGGPLYPSFFPSTCLQKTGSYTRDCWASSSSH